MESKKINQLATAVSPSTSDLAIIGDPVTGVSKKITWLQVSTLIGTAANLQQVTDNGATTTNPVTIGGLTITGLSTGVLKSDSGVISSVPFGAANGVATLGGDGKVPSSQLPSYVDDVVEVANYAALPVTGETGKLYITLDNNKVYRWGGSVYVEVAANNAVWGSITGTLANQTDLQNALNAKVPTSRTITINGTSYDLSANRTWSVGTLTSVGLTMPSGFSVASSPLTGAGGTIAITGAGDSTQYIDGSGALQTFPTLLSSDNLVKLVRNQSGATMTAGTIVYISGATGNKPLISKAIATSDATSAQTYGLVQANIANNADGYVVVIGNVGSLDTSALTEGQQLYLSGTTAGAYTTTKPYAPTHLVYVGIVLRSHPVSGIIGVKIQNGYEMDELHNVDAYAPSNNDILSYNTTTSLWEHKQIATTLGFTPISLSSLSATSPLSYNNGTGAFSIQVASSTQNGYLASGDWSIFNNKQAALGGTGFVKISGSTISYDNSTYYLASNPSAYITLASLSAGAGISYSNITGVISSTITQYTDALARAAFSESVLGLDYSSTTGVLSTTTGYGIPTTTKQTQWDTAYGWGNPSGVYLPLIGGDLTGVLTSTISGGSNITLNKSSGSSIAFNKTAATAQSFLIENNGGSTLRIYDGTSAVELLSVAALTGDTTIKGKIIKNGGTSSQFLKADGSVDSSTYLTTSSASSTYVPYTGATANVNLDAYAFQAGGIITTGRTTSDIGGSFVMKIGNGSNNVGDASSVTMYAPSTSQLMFVYKDASSIIKLVSLSPSQPDSSQRYFSWPSSDGQIALVSQIPSLTGYVTGSGTLNKIAKFTATGSAIGDSNITDNGTTTSINGLLNVGSGTTTSASININSNDSTATYLYFNGAGVTNNHTRITGLEGASSNLRFYTGNIQALTINSSQVSTFSGRVDVTISSGHNIILSKGTGASINFNKTNATAQSWSITTDPNFRIADDTASIVPLEITLGTGATKFISSVTATSFIKTSGTSSQFLKADGSVDSSTYLTTSSASSTYVPYTGATTDVNLGTRALSAGNILGSTINASQTSNTQPSLSVSNAGTFRIADFNNSGALVAYITNSGSIYGASFVKSGGSSSQFLKADGSVDSNTYITSGSFLPLTGGALTGALSITHSSGETLTLNKGTGPSIAFNKTDTTAQSWSISGEGTAFKIYNSTSSTIPFQLTTSNTASFVGNIYMQSSGNPTQLLVKGTNSEFWVDSNYGGGTARAFVNRGTTSNQATLMFSTGVAITNGTAWAGSCDYSMGVSNDGSGNFFIGSGDIYSSGNRAITITSSKNVGIGTSSPATDALLTILGNISLGNRNVLNTSRYIGLDGSYGANAAQIGFQVDGSYNSYITFNSVLSGISAGMRMILTKEGNLCIGKSSYDNTTTGISLVGDTGGGIGIGSFVADGGACMLWNRKTSTGDIVIIRYNSSGVGSISTNGTTTSYNVTSDYRLKQDYKEFNGMSIIDKIKIYDFQWKSDKSRMYGVIAHELQGILPIAVTGEKDAINEDGNIAAQGVDYSKIVPILVKAIQELKLEIQELKNN